MKEKAEAEKAEKAKAASNSSVQVQENSRVKLTEEEYWLEQKRLALEAERETSKNTSEEVLNEEVLII